MLTESNRHRRAGILLHPTSLPSRILDDDVERWLDLLADAGASVWQMLPLGEPQLGLSPYQCISAFAINPALLPMLPETDTSSDVFIDFCNRQAFWLDDYVLFKVLKKAFRNLPWTEWPEALKTRDQTELEQARDVHHDAIVKFKCQQFQLDRRWHEIKQMANQRDILLFGDMPIFVGHDSADVWSHPEWFQLDDQGYMTVVTGVPPDYFSETGQRWGNPHYHWQNMKKDNYSWWESRISHHLERFDLIRIDHFRGLEAAWTIEANCDTAIDGYWQPIPGDDLLNTLMRDLDDCKAQLPFVAEDLGLITPEVTALRKKYHLPGMSILQFGFDHFDDNPHKLKNITPDCVVYTGTHDNDTTKGWFDSLPDYDKKHVLTTLELKTTQADENTGEMAINVVNRMIDLALKSPAEICIIPMQDILYLGSQARMNTPGTIEGNWCWHFDWGQVNQDTIRLLREQIGHYGRLPTA